MTEEPRDVLDRDEGRVLFGRDPGAYDAGRPEYPERVYDVLADRCGLGARSVTLEIGPGTGLVTRRLVAFGASVTAVEPDPGLADYLVKALPSVTVRRETLEATSLPAQTFDVVVAATSLHWVDQRVGLSQLGECLKPGGWFACWWTLFRDPGRPDPFAEAVEEILGPETRGAFDEPDRPPFQLDEHHRVRDLARWAGLIDVQAEQMRSSHTFSAQQAKALYASMATVLRRPPSEQVRLLDAIEQLAADRYGGVVERRFVTALYTGRRPG